MTEGIIDRVLGPKIKLSRSIENDFRIPKLDFRIRHRLVADILEQVYEELRTEIRKANPACEFSNSLSHRKNFCVVCDDIEPVIRSIIGEEKKST